MTSVPVRDVADVVHGYNITVYVPQIELDNVRPCVREDIRLVVVKGLEKVRCICGDCGAETTQP